MRGRRERLRNRRYGVVNELSDLVLVTVNCPSDGRFHTPEKAVSHVVPTEMVRTGLGVGLVIPVRVPHGDRRFPGAGGGGRYYFGGFPAF